MSGAISTSGRPRSASERKAFAAAMTPSGSETEQQLLERAVRMIGGEQAHRAKQAGKQPATRSPGRIERSRSGSAPDAPAETGW